MKKILVTGANKGIGLGIVYGFLVGIITFGLGMSDDAMWGFTQSLRCFSWMRPIPHCISERRKLVPNTSLRYLSERP